MRIAHVTYGRCNPDSANGVEKTVTALARVQAGMGHAAAVFSITDKPPIPLDPVESHSMPGRRFILGRRPRFQPLLAFGPDVVHLHSVFIADFAALAKRLHNLGIAYVVTPHAGLSSTRLGKRKWLKKAFKLLLERNYWTRAAFVHAVSRHEIEEFRAYGITAPIVVAPNAIDWNAVPAGSALDPQALTRRFPQLSGKRVAIFVGRLAWSLKGLDFLLAAMAQVATSAPDLSLLIVGPDSEGAMRRIHQASVRGGLAERVCLAGPVFGKDKWNLMAGAQALVLTSRCEGLPFVVLEAAAIGKPAIVSRAADPERKVEEFDTGWVCDPAVDSVASALARFAHATPEEIREKGKLSHRMVEREFSWNVTAAKLIEAYAGRHGEN